MTSYESLPVRAEARPAVYLRLFRQWLSFGAKLQAFRPIMIAAYL
jgi:hypothetical protein